MPSPYRYLLEETDARGYKRLVESTDGTRLLTDVDCESCGCAGDCAMIRKWTACPLPPDIRPCTTDPDQIWTCEPIKCGGTAKYGNRCYTRTDILIPVAQLPSGDLLVPRSSLLCDKTCADPDCTECQAYYEATICPGQNPPNNPNDPVPRVFVPVECFPTGACYGFVYPFAGFGLCMTVKPGQVFRRYQLPANYAIVDCLQLQANFRCCDCVPGCSHFIGPLELLCPGSTPAPIVDCCCADSFKYRLNWTYNWRREERIFNISTGQIELTTYTISFTVTMSGQVVNGAQGPSTGGTVTGTMLAAYGDGSVILYPFTASTGQWSSCIAGWPAVGFGFDQTALPALFNPRYYCQNQTGPNGEVVTVNGLSQSRSCTGATFLNIWRLVSPSGAQPDVIETGTYQLSCFIFTQDSKCGDGCGRAPKPIIGPPLPPPDQTIPPEGSTDPNAQAVAAAVAAQNAMRLCAGCGDGWQG